MKESKSELDATYEKVMEAFDKREHRQKRMNLMILGLYAVIVVTMFVGAWL